MFMTDVSEMNINSLPPQFQLLLDGKSQGLAFISYFMCVGGVCTVIWI